LDVLHFTQIKDSISLTMREAEVADLLTLGLTDDELCIQLCISKPTLRTHIAAIFRKTNIQRRSQLSQFLINQYHHL
jgi:DNA-binding CsgD family transcriptional regulator